jgi:hypothetical protein
MITASLLRSWSACWSDEQIRTRLGTRTAVTPREVATDTSISVGDRLWVVCKALWYLDEDAARYFAIETALSVAHLAGDEDDQAQFLGLMNDLMCAQDLPEDRRAAARDAAWAAARDAAWAAARDAAWDAAWAAARDAAWAAARDAAWAAARDAAWDAAWAAAWAAARDAAWAAARAAARDAAWAAARDAAWAAARDAAWDADIEKSIARALSWLGDYANGWEEAEEEGQAA